MTKRVAREQSEVSAVQDVKEDGTFDYTLPNGSVVKDATEEDLFDAFLADLETIKQDLREYIAELDRSVVASVKELKKVAARRGRIVLVRDDDLNPVDVLFQGKEGRS